MKQVISMDLGHKSYDIVLDQGQFKLIGKWLKTLWPLRKVFIVTDEHVAAHYLELLVTSLESAGYQVFSHVLPSGESTKSLATAERLYAKLSEVEMTKSDGLVALGGGVIGDLTGFVASTYMRGVPFVQIPTSLLAQVDSAIGGKTGVNSTFAKNMIGTIYQPDGVFIDPDLLRTLPIKRLSEGMAEIIKCAMIADYDLWQALKQLSGLREMLTDKAQGIIAMACQVKVKAVVADEMDNGQRMTLNFGHTIGHAIESTLGYERCSHGEAVALGMVMISRHTEKEGLSEKGITQALIQMLQKFDLPTDISGLDNDVLYQKITHDKKARGSMLNLILVPKIGRAQIQKIPLLAIKHYIN